MKAIFVAVLIFCLAMIFYQIISRKNEIATLREKGKLTVGKTLSFRSVSKLGNRVTYVFAVGGNQIVEDDEKTEIDGSFFQSFKDKSFPVIYDPDQPGKTNCILLTKSDFTLFNVPIPDTLNALMEETN